MDALGYSPLQAARQMRGSGSGNIAVVVPTITNNFFAQLVDSIERTCGRFDYRTLIMQTYGKKSGEEAALNLLRMQHADGAILSNRSTEAVYKGADLRRRKTRDASDAGIKRAAGCRDCRKRRSCSRHGHRGTGMWHTGKTGRHRSIRNLHRDRDHKLQCRKVRRTECTGTRKRA